MMIMWGLMSSNVPGALLLMRMPYLLLKLEKYDDHVGLKVLKCPLGSFTDEAAITVTKIRKI